MASRKEQKEQARQTRLAKEQEEAARKQRRRRFEILGGISAVAIGVIVAVIIISVSGSSGSKANVSTGLSSGNQEHQLYSSINTLLSGIPQSGTTLGSPSAPVTMQYFGDLECPICQEFTLDIFPQFVQDQVRAGHVKVTYRSMCTATCDGKLSQQQETDIFDRQQIAAYAAGQQNKFWDFAELFYHQQETEGTGYPTDAFLTGIAKEIPGLSVTKWQTDRTNPSLADQLNADTTYASKAGLPGTPSLLMKGPKGELLVNNGNFPSYTDLVNAIKTVDPGLNVS